MKLRIVVGLVAAGASLPACLFYDSRWGQSTAEQKHTAARLRPAEMHASPGSGEDRPRTASIRACATRAYASETLGWQDRWAELVRNASSVLAPAIGLTLRNAGTSLWEPEHGEAGLDAVIDDLPSCEGPETDWVVALVQSTPKLVSDFHVLGRGKSYSPYLAVRAPNDPAEMEGLSRALPDLDEATRQRLYSERKRHKTLTVFLHELAHTLGGIHRSAKDTIMSPAYDASERGFDDATLSLLRVGLVVRLDSAARRLVDARAYLEAHPDGFVETDRAEQIAFLRRWEAVHPVVTTEGAQAPTPEPPKAVEAMPFEKMPLDDRQAFDEALKLEPTSPRDAWTIAAPLFETHPAVREVQELRCRLAKERKFFAAVIEAHCARLAALGGPATAAVAP